MRGRKKQYDSPAQKQAAYRARKTTNIVTDGVLRNCPNCGGELMDLTDMNPTFDFISFLKPHNGRGYICKVCWQATTTIPGAAPVTGELLIKLRPGWHGMTARSGEEADEGSKK